MSAKLQNICNTFKVQALFIADEVDKAGYTGLGIQEETFTDLLLNRIQFEHEECFFTRKFTRKEEGSITGADCLWCIGEPGSWITFAVQAKIANVKTGRVNYLHYKSGEQYNLLINFSKHFGFIPRYSIYAKVNKEIELFTQKINGFKDIPSEQWAFLMVSPKYIKHLSTRKERYISSVLQFSIPWVYVFCTVASNNGSIAEVIAGNLEKIYWLIENKFRQQRNQTVRDNFNRVIWENPQPFSMITKTVPLPVLYLLTQKSFSYKIPIANVSIFSNVPVQRVLDFELTRIKGTRQWKNFPIVFERKVVQIQGHIIKYLLLEERW